MNNPKSLKIFILIAMSFLMSTSYAQEVCNNGIDDDNDGLIDLNDSLDCACNSGFPGIINSLFPNSSFEDTLCCPNDFSQMGCSEFWVQASEATSDFYHSCDFSVPNNNFISPPQFPIPDNGEGYVGFVCGANGEEPYLEYVGTCLNTPLLAGTSYSLQFYTALGFNQTAQDIAIFGSTDCEDLPWTGSDCPDGTNSWMTLTDQTVFYSPDGAWQQVTLTFTPTVDIYAIAIGGSCGLREPNTTSYYYMDGLTLQTTDSFNPIINIDQESCSGIVDLVAQQYDPSIVIQWYLNGVALPGEIDDTLHTVNYGEGIYTLEFDDGSNICKRSNISINPDQYLLPDFDDIMIETGCADSSQNVITLQNIYGGDTVYYVDLIQTPGNYNNSQEAGQNDTLVFDGLDTGFYQVQISNTKGCAIDTIIEIVEDINPGLATRVNPKCYGGSTGAIIAGTTLTSEVEYTILDENGNVLNSNGGDTVNGLTAGSYTIITLDVTEQCATSLSVELYDPNAITPNLDLIQPLCHDSIIGSAKIDTVLFAQGNYDEIDYHWYGDNVNNGLSYNNYSGNLTVGTYRVKITDGLGCSQNFEFIIKPPNPIVGVLDIISPTYCRVAGYQKGNGEVTASTLGPNASGSGNIIYHWRNLENGDESDNSTFVVNVPGWMEATLTDINGCIFKDTIYVDSINPKAEFTPVSNQFNGPSEFEGTEPMHVNFINESINFSKSSYNLSDTAFSWNLFANEANVSETGQWFLSFDYDESIKTTYTGEHEYLVCLVAKNFNNCRDTTCEVIIVHRRPELIVPNVFTPGVSPNQDFFFPNIGISDFTSVIYNRYGVEVFRFNSIEDKWDGNHYRTGEPCTDGVYYFDYSATSTDHTIFSGQGSLQLLRSK